MAIPNLWLNSVNTQCSLPALEWLPPYMLLHANTLRVWWSILLFQVNKSIFNIAGCMVSTSKCNCWIFTPKECWIIKKKLMLMKPSLKQYLVSFFYKNIFQLPVDNLYTWLDRNFKSETQVFSNEFKMKS